MAGLTNRGKKRMLEICFRAENIPGGFYVALIKSTTPPNADINTLGQLAQIATGNGYSDGGYLLSSGSAGFDYLSQVDALDVAVLQLSDVSWTASGGNIPSSGSGARYACLTDNNATVANREVFCYWDLLADRSVSSGYTLVIQNLQVKLVESI